MTRGWPRSVRSRRSVLAVLALVLGGGAPPAASAHGPCGCLDPVLAQVGGTVRIAGGPGDGQAGRGWPAYKVVFNPRHTDLGIAPAHLISAYRREAPTVTVLTRSRSDPTRRGSFRVPKTPDGLYMVLIFDGSEGGAHNTWDYLHVIDPNRHAPGQQRAPAPPRTRQRTGTPSTTASSKADRVLPALVGAAGGGMLTLTGVWLIASRRRRN